MRCALPSPPAATEWSVLLLHDFICSERVTIPNPRLYITPLPIIEVQQVSSAKLLGVTLCDTFRFDVHVGNVLKMCSQRVYLLKLLRDQALPRPQLNTVFDALVLSRLRYAVPVWSGFMSVELKGQVNSFLKCFL